MFYILGVLWEREIIKKTFESLSTKCHKLQLKKVMNKAQAGINIARRNVNNLKYTDDTTLMGESEEELRAS